MPSKAFRFTETDCELLERICGRDGITQIEAIRRGLRCLDSADTRDIPIDTPQHGPERRQDHVIDALVDQLAAKDEQIASLMTALNTAQETAKAAQALHASTAMTALESAEQKSARRGLLSRLLGR